jgi:hypothetical protein
MTRTIWSGTCVAISVVLVAGLTADSRAASQDKSAPQITVMGCIQRAQGREAGFALTNAAVITISTTGADGTTLPSLAVAREDFRLDADAAKLNPDVGHTVQIGGTVEQQAHTFPGQPKAGVSPVRLPAVIKVDTIRMIASACS